MVGRLKAIDIARLRSQAGRAAGIFVTDRCPVGCAHCSVDSRTDSPTITDFTLFKELLVGLAAQTSLEVVAITGGEPTVERRGMTLAIDILKGADKKIVLFTSGIWASARVPLWIRRALRQIDTVFLSTDNYHDAAVDKHTFVTAAQTIGESNCWIVVQTLDREPDHDLAKRLLIAAFGNSYTNYAEIVVSNPLPYGRGEQLFHIRDSIQGKAFGPCGLLSSPLVRYDGRMTACCNEKVIMGHGSSRLARKCNNSADVRDAFEYFHDDALFKVVRSIGFEALTTHPTFSGLSTISYPDICHVCWAANDLVDSTPDPLLDAIAILASRE